MKKLVFITILFLLISPVFAGDADDEIYSYILRQSRIYYEHYLNKKGTFRDSQWEEAITAAFMKLSSASGERGFDATCALINDDTFNAACFPGGQFVINKGALRIMDEIIKNRKNPDKSKNIQEQREELIAPLIAHELGHHYNRHQFKAFKQMMEFLESSNDDIELKSLRYSVANEYEADYTGYILMNKAGYDTDLMLELLELMNTLYQEDLKNAGRIETNQYFQTHPSPHKRIARFKSNRQEYHQTASELEKAFDDVHVGINLDRAVDYLENAEKKFPGNLYIKKERAVALHKLWLATVPIDEQKLKGIIDSPAFRDDMIYKTERSQGKGAEIPGDKVIYEKSLEAYMNIYKNTSDPGFYSNMALLLVYSPEEDRKKLAVELAYNAAVLTKRIDLASNFAVILYLIGEKEKCRDIMYSVAVTYDNQYQNLMDKASYNADYALYIQSLRKNVSVAGELNSSYVIDDFTPLLNLALISGYSGNKELARSAAVRYLTAYENGSKWAQYMSNIAGVEIKRDEKQYLAVDGVKVLDTIQQLLNKWGKADAVFPVTTTEELWNYRSRDVKVSIVDGRILQITLDSRKSRKIENGIGVGSTRKEVEKLLGKHSCIKNGYYVYTGKQDIAIIYVRNMARTVLLLP